MPVQQLQHTQIYIEKCCEAKIERKKAKFCIVIELRCFIREWDIFFFLLLCLFVNVFDMVMVFSSVSFAIELLELDT